MFSKSRSQSLSAGIFVPFVEFLGAFLGDNCEVVLHDIRDKEGSILAIANGHISGRLVGAPLTDRALQFFIDEVYLKQDWVIGYTGISRSGNPLHCATYFIKNLEGKLLGMLCLNMDTSDIMAARDMLDKFMGCAGFNAASNEAEQDDADQDGSFPQSMEDLTEALIMQVIAEKSVSPKRMTAEERMEIVATLSERGVFMLKGAVKDVARKLSVSEATAYRYLHKTSMK